MNKGVVYCSGLCYMGYITPLLKTLSAVPRPGDSCPPHYLVLCVYGRSANASSQLGLATPALRQRRTVLTFIASALLLAINWYTIWGSQRRIHCQTSLGYFINPLVNVLLGYALLHEESACSGPMAGNRRGRRGRTLSDHQLWCGALDCLTLAFSFGAYGGLLRKTSALNSAEGLFTEMAVLFLPAFGLLLLMNQNGTGAFAHSSLTTTLLLIGSGAVTSIPLILFAAGARRVTLTSLGLLQYIAPTLQFLIGVVIYHEDFGPSRMIGFGLIWVALILYTAEGIAHYRRTHADDQITRPAV
ncbi:MAG: EamA family transporter RarD [Chloroflexota bacterium]